MNTLKLDINDIGNIMYIRRIMSMVGNTSPYDIIISISKLIVERSKLDLTTAFAPLRDLQSHIGLLTDALKIKAQFLSTPVSVVSQGRALPENFGRSILVSPTVNHSTLAPFSSTLKTISPTATTSPLMEVPAVVDKNSLFFYFFKVLIVSTVCIGAFFICKNLFQNYIDSNLDDQLFTKFSHIEPYNKLLKTHSKQDILDFFTVDLNQTYSLFRPTNTFRNFNRILDTMVCMGF